MENPLVIDKVLTPAGFHQRTCKLPRGHVVVYPRPAATDSAVSPREWVVAVMGDVHIWAVCYHRPHAVKLGNWLSLSTPTQTP